MLRIYFKPNYTNPINIYVCFEFECDFCKRTTTFEYTLSHLFKELLNKLGE